MIGDKLPSFFTKILLSVADPEDARKQAILPNLVVGNVLEKPVEKSPIPIVILPHKK